MCQLGSEYFAHNKITSAFKTAEYVGDITSYIELRGYVRHIMVLNARAPIKNKSDGSRAVFYVEDSG
jgi:hypothetical protein